MTVVLDASALLAVFGDEPGAERVAALLDGGTVSAVNWSEVLGRYVREGLDTTHRQEQVEALGLSLVAFTPRQAELAAGMLPITRDAGLSLADRACLAVALDFGAPVITADGAWLGVDVGVEVELIR